MILRTFVRTFAALASLALFATTANAVTSTQTFTMPLTPTDISGVTGTGTFNYFQSIGAPPGSVLTSVSLRIAVTETLQALSVSNTDPTNSQTFKYQSSSNIVPVGTGPAADLPLLNTALFANGGVISDIDLIDTGNVTFLPSQTIVYAPPASNHSDDSLLVSAASISPYNTTGTFTLGFTTTTSQSFIGGGGNGSSTQDTAAVGTVQVVYNYTVVPEPSTLILFGCGLLGLVARRRVRC